MSNNKNHRRRSNSLDLNLNKNKTSEEFRDETDDILSKSVLLKKKEMFTYKNKQNIDLTTYDYIFVGRQFSEDTVQDFSSFIQYLNNIKSKYNPSFMKINDISEANKKEGKFSFTHDNLTKLISFNKKKNKNIEISINNKYIKTYNLDNKYINFYTSKSFFKGKHCYEIEILNMEKPNLYLGLINISYIDPFRTTFKNLSSLKINALSHENMDNIIFHKISEPFFIQKNDEIYNHYISYGDILGCCYDFDNKLFYLFLNGEIITTFVLNIEVGKKYRSFLPMISIGNYTEIIFNPGYHLEYMKSYEKFGFVPLDEKGKNNYEISKLREVTDQFRNILINNGKTIINSQKISYSDINQIYHIIFDFIGNVSFQHSYIIQKSFLKEYLDLCNQKKFDAKDFDLWYLILKYILNSSKDKNLIIKKIFLNLTEAIHIFLRKGINSLNEVQSLLKLFIYLFRKPEFINILSKMPKTLIKIFRSIFVSFHIHDSKLGKNNFDFIIKKNNNNNIPNNNNNITSLNLNNNNNNNNRQSNNNININNRINIHNNDMNRENTQNNNNNDNNNNLYFPNIIISKHTLNKTIDLNQINLITNSKDIVDLYSQFINILFKNGTENENKNIFNIFKQFYEKETDSIFKSIFRNRINKFYDLFKSIFISAMKSFNNEYKNKNRIISIKRYLSEYEVDGEKIGGTIKHIFEEYVNQIPNFENLIKHKINNYDNIIFIQLIYFFFVREYSEDIWDLLYSVIKKMIDCSHIYFLKDVKNESFEKIHESLIDYINFNLYLINLNDLEIFIQFLYNLSDFILNELYPKKLIYFIPEIIIYRFEYVLNFINVVSLFLKAHYNYILIIKEKQKFNSFRDGKKEEIISKLMKLNEKCFRQYLSILIKIIGDQNIKKLILKCESVESLKKHLYLVELFSDEDLNAIFTFINSIHNNSEYKKYTYRFLKIFDGKINSKISKYYNLGLRINKLCKNNKNFLRILIILLYKNLNISLTILEERFCEYKFNPISNRNQINQILNNNNPINNNNNNNNNQINNNNNNNQINNNNNNQINNNNNNNNLINNNSNNNLINNINNINNQIDNINNINNQINNSNNNNNQINNANNNNNQINNNNINNINNINNQINNINNNLNNINILIDSIFIGLENRSLFRIRRINNAELSDNDKLIMLEESFGDVKNQFLKLINFYQISSDIKELYDFNSFEYKILLNLLLSLYNIIFSPNNIKKIDDKNISYKNLLNEVNNFYNIIISNIIKQNNQDILKEISKQRNNLYFKEILQILEKFNPIKNERDNKYKYFKDFIEKLEMLVPKEEVKTKIDIDNDKQMTNSGNKIENNLCNICADSIIDTHLIPCDHSLCRNCLFQCLSENKTCPFCRVEIKGIKEDPNFKIINS